MLHPPLHRLFFAFRPPAGAVGHIAAEQGRFGPGRRIRCRHFHITTAILADYATFPQAQADRMIAAGDMLPVDAFRLILDLAVASDSSVALRPSEPLPALHAFQKRLAHAMRDAGLAMRPRWRFHPHMTLLYRAGLRFAAPVDAISWQATEFVLIHSLVGLGRHEVLARWPLRVSRAAALC